MSPRTKDRERSPAEENTTRSKCRRRAALFALWLTTALLVGFGASSLRSPDSSGPNTQTNAGLVSTSNGQGINSASEVTASHLRNLSALLSLSDADLEKVDVIELNLAVARELPECWDLDVCQYQRTVDEWAARVKQEVDHTWPYEVDLRWEREHHVLKSLTMREYAAVMVGCLGAYYQVKEDYASAIRWDALAHWLDPANRSTFALLCVSVDGTQSRYFDADELAGRKKYWELTPHPSVAGQRGHIASKDMTPSRRARPHLN